MTIARTDFLELTRSDDSKICIGRAWIQAVRPARLNDYVRGITTEVYLSGETIGVKEDYTTVRAMLILVEDLKP